MSVQSIENGSLALNNLDVSTINGSVYPPSSSAGTLSAVLAQGNTASNIGINMNNQTIVGVSTLSASNVNLTTINSSAYPPITTTPTLSAVLAQGNIASNIGINMNGNDIDDVAIITADVLNGSLAGGVSGSIPYQTGSNATSFLGIGTVGQVLTSSGTLPSWSSVSTSNLSSVLTAGSDAGNQSITGVNNIALTTINGSTYPPTTPYVPNTKQVFSQVGTLSLPTGNQGGTIISNITLSAGTYIINTHIEYGGTSNWGFDNGTTWLSIANQGANVANNCSLASGNGSGGQFVYQDSCNFYQLTNSTTFNFETYLLAVSGGGVDIYYGLVEVLRL